MPHDFIPAVQLPQPVRAALQAVRAHTPPPNERTTWAQAEVLLASARQLVATLEAHVRDGLPRDA